MESIEIILEDFRKDKLDKLVFEELNVSSSEVKSSHFFDNNRGEDIEFHQIKSLQEVLSPTGTGNVFLYHLTMGCILKDVMIIFSFDEYLGEITFNFSEDELFAGEYSEQKLKVKKIVETLVDIKDKYDITKIKIGFEPATDDDNCLVELDHDAVDLEIVTDKILS